MVEALAVRAPKRDAEATRRRLMELGVLRIDLEVARADDDVLFPVVDSCGPRLPTEPWQFAPRARRASDYRELLRDWTAEELELAPRAFDQLGDIVITKVPPALEARAAELGAALLAFHPGCRAVFHDRGVVGTFRTRDLVRIAGDGPSLTQFGENGFRFWVDPAKAYFSPRLGHERQRVAALVRPGEHVVDLFGGVGAFAVLAAARGATVDSVDLNPDAAELARRNAKEAGLPEGRLRVHEGDARAVADRLAPADRIVMNLPHGAHGFLDVAVRLCAPAGVVHYHEILPRAGVEARTEWLIGQFASLGRAARVEGRRLVRNYSAQDDHMVWDLRLA